MSSNHLSIVDLGSNNYKAMQKNGLNMKQNLILSRGRISTAQLSKNKRFIAIGQKIKINIWFNRRSKIMKQIKFRSRIMESIFSSDDNYIYVALPKQLVLVSMLYGLQQVYQNSKGLDILGDYIQNIKELNDREIIFSYDDRILIYDFKNLCLTKVVQLENQVNGFDYINENKTLICCQNSLILSLFINNNLFMEQKLDNYHQYIDLINEEDIEIKQLKFFNNSYNVIVQVLRDLTIWEIDYGRKRFIKSLNIEANNINYFHSIKFQISNIIVISKKNIYTYSLVNGEYKKIKNKKQISFLKCIKFDSKLNRSSFSPYIILEMK